jgi:hypothetical protein
VRQKAAGGQSGDKTWLTGIFEEDRCGKDRNLARDPAKQARAVARTHSRAEVKEMASLSGQLGPNAAASLVPGSGLPGGLVAGIRLFVPATLTGRYCGALGFSAV